MKKEEKVAKDLTKKEQNNTNKTNKKKVKIEKQNKKTKENRKKKEKQEKPELVLGEKIKDVKINQKQHFLLFVSMLILFNILLIISVGFVLIYLDRWYNWVICFAFVGVSLALSFKTFRDVKDFHKCELYDNAIVIKSIWFNLIVDLKDIYELKVKTSKLDKIFKLNTQSLEVKLMNNRRKKFTIHFIEENAVQLKQEIIKLMDTTID